MEEKEILLDIAAQIYASLRYHKGRKTWLSYTAIELSKTEKIILDDFFKKERSNNEKTRIKKTE